MGTASIAASDSPIRIRQLRKALRGNTHIELVRRIDRAFIRIACPRHEWNWPLSNLDGAKVDGFNAHQNCTKCASELLFNSMNWTPGTMSRKGSHGSEANKPDLLFEQCADDRSPLGLDSAQKAPRLYIPVD